MTTGQIRLAQARSRKGRRSPLAVAALASERAALPGTPVLQTKYRELTRRHVGSLDRLFAEFTGLHFHVAWAPVIPGSWPANTLPTACPRCRELAGTKSRAANRCPACGPAQLVRTLAADGGGHCFTCGFGLHNYWLPIRIRGVTVGIAYVQAPDRGKGHRSDPNLRPRRMVRSLDRSEFDSAARLLRLMVQHIQSLDVAEWQSNELATARRAVTALAEEQSHLREELARVIPTISRRGGVRLTDPETRAERAVHLLLEHVQRNFGQPITLQRFAARLELNAAYLSALFSRMVGLPFKTYLTELRLNRARELLGDGARSISSVATEVGYSSENRFRIAFKKSTGLSPRFWRDTVRASN